MEKSSYQKLRERLNRVDFMTKYLIKKKTEELTGDYSKDRYNVGFIKAMQMIQDEMKKHEESND